MTTPAIFPPWVWIGAAAQLASAIACAWLTVKAIGERERAEEAHQTAMRKIAADMANNVRALTIEHLNKMEKDVDAYIASETFRTARLERAVFGRSADEPAPPAAPGKVH